MRIVSWNMNRKGVSALSHQAAWEFLRDELKADVVLAQEAVPPATLRQQVFSSTALPGYQWGSAVVAFRDDLSLRALLRVPLAESIPSAVAADSLPESHPGASAVAKVYLGGERLFVAVSLYGQWEAMPGGKKYLAGPRVHRTLSDLTGLFERSRRCPVVLAGDFNVSTQGERSANNEAAAIFARLRAWQMADALRHTRASRGRLEGCKCADGDECAHVPTFRSGAQLDYAFLSDNLLSALSACGVETAEVARRLSDHYPIVMDIAETAEWR